MLDQQAKQALSFFVHYNGTTCSVLLDRSNDIADLKQSLAISTGVPAHDQVLNCCGRQLRSGLLSKQIQPGSTVQLLGRLCGGQQTTVSITLQPRVQKDKWSMYWKESMATKTESLAAVTMQTDVNTTVAALQQKLAEKLGWQPKDSLVRLEGFKDDWEFAVHQGRAVKLSASLKENGITSDATITTVRRVLIPEAWKSIAEMQEGGDETSSSEEEEF